MLRLARTLLCGLLAVLAAMLVAPAAQASVGQFTTFEAPDLLGRRATQVATLDELRGLGVDSIRYVLYWQDVAPQPDSTARPQNFDATDPNAYGSGYSVTDSLISQARARGMRVHLTITGPGPRWATRRKRDRVTEPSPTEFRRFTEATARRYRDAVGVWSIWNEPNHPLFLQPQFRGGEAYSPRLYRLLYIAGEAGLRSGGVRSAPILMGELAPRGTGRVVAPLRFLRISLCLNARYRRARRCARVAADGYAIHPYTVAGNPFFRPSNPDDVTIGVVDRLVTALDRAARAGMVRRGLPVYLSEFGVQSEPDPFGASLAEQSDFRSIAELIAYRNRRVKGFSQYLLRDSAPREGPPAQRYSGFESGLRFYEGGEKPAYDGFRLPLVVERRGSRVSIWGLVRPATGGETATVQMRDGAGEFRDLEQVRLDARGYLRLSSEHRSGRSWRLRFGNLAGPPTAAYGPR